MTKRIKPVLTVASINTLEEADTMLACIAARKRELTLHELGLKEDVSKLKLECSAACEPIKNDITGMELALARFAEARKAELFAKKKTVGLTFGSFGYRASSTLKTLKKLTWDNVLGFLAERGMSACIRTKPEVDKEALRQLPPEQLAEVGCRLVQEDTFFYELIETEIAGTDAA